MLLSAIHFQIWKLKKDIKKLTLENSPRSSYWETIVSRHSRLGSTESEILQIHLFRGGCYWFENLPVSLAAPFVDPTIVPAN